MKYCDLVNCPGMYPSSDGESCIEICGGIIQNHKNFKKNKIFKKHKN